jgi:diguanylate cyclase (GGDEF)-like protein/PAS domain S-box-containing protein
METMRDTETLQLLLVEDSENDALLVTNHLERAGYGVRWERVDAPEALEQALNQKPWDMVLSDYTMPRFRGTDALEIVRRHNPDVPFIFVSGTIGEETAVTAMRSGANDYVMKDNLSRLVPAIRRELEEARNRVERRQAEEKLRKLSLVVEQATDSVFVCDHEGRIEYVNPSFERLTGYRSEEVVGRIPALFRDGSGVQHDGHELWQVLRQGKTFRGTITSRRKNGDIFYEEKIITPLTNAAGNITHYVSTGRDVTERMQAEDARDRLVEILENTTDFVGIMEGDGTLNYLNGSGRTLLGIEADTGLSAWNLTATYPDWVVQHLQQDAFPTARREGVWKGETALRGAEEQEVPISQVILAHRGDDGGVRFFSTIARDITERKLFEAELRFHTTHDSLTLLPNRALLTDRLQTEIGRAAGQGAFVAVISLDIDNFKRINDSLGRAGGDEALNMVAQRLWKNIRPSDTLARHGGDEFTVVIGNLAKIENVMVVVHKLLGLFEAPIQIKGEEAYLTLSAGIAIYPHDGNDAETLLKHADTAMYEAHGNGANQYRFYAPEMHASSYELLTLENDLRHALERREFQLHYQPVFDLHSGTILGFEALLRWQHPQRGLIMPMDFIPLLEQLGLFLPVGEWVMRRACAEIHSYWESVSDMARIAVNLSAQQFLDPGLIDMVRAILTDEKIPHGKLELEIAERSIMQDVTASGGIMAALKGLGVRLAMDDFGTGYSSLAYLQRLPLDVLKIDRAFVQGVPQNANSAVITEAGILLGRKLGMAVVAEGVETAEQLEFLRAQGCDMMQGFYLSQPLPISEISRFVNNEGK